MNLPTHIVQYRSDAESLNVNLLLLFLGHVVYNGLAVEPGTHNMIEALYGHVFLCESDAGVYEGGVGDRDASYEARECGECGHHPGLMLWLLLRMMRWIIRKRNKMMSRMKIVETHLHYIYSQYCIVTIIPTSLLRSLHLHDFKAHDVHELCPCLRRLGTKIHNETPR